MGKQKDIEDVAEQARSGFDLASRLMGAPRLEKTVTVYTDPVTGKALGGAENATDRGIIIGRKRWGVLGDIDRLEERIKIALNRAEAGEDHGEDLDALESELADLKKKSASLLKKLDSTALVFTLRAVPGLVIRDARRKARKNLNIKAKGISADQEEAFQLEVTNIVLAASTVQYVDNKSKQTIPTLSVEDATALRDYLPVGQYDKLDIALAELSLEAQIGNHATDSADF